MNKNNTAIEKLKLEKSTLEKELRATTTTTTTTSDDSDNNAAISPNPNNNISPSSPSSLKHPIDEPTVCAELEALEIFKSENTALKTQIHEIASKSDQQQVTIAILTHELATMRDEKISENQNNCVAAVATNVESGGAGAGVTEKVIRDFEVTISKLRQENNRLDLELIHTRKEVVAEQEKNKKASEEIQQLKNTAGSGSNNNAFGGVTTGTVAAIASSAAAANSASHNATVGLKSWWSTSKSTAAAPTVAANSATVAAASTSTTTLPGGEVSKIKDQLKAANDEIEKLKASLDETFKKSSSSKEKKGHDVTATVFSESVAAAEVTIRELQTEVQDLKKQLETAKDSIKSLEQVKEAAIGKASFEIKELISTNEQFIQKTKDFEAKILSLENQLVVESKLTESAKAETATLETQCTNSNTAFSLKITTLEKSLVISRSEIETLKTTIQELTNRAHTLYTESINVQFEHEKIIQGREQERNELIAQYEAAAILLQESILLKSIEIQTLQQQIHVPTSSSAEDNNPVIEDVSTTVNTINAANFTAALDIHLFPAFESLKNGYETDKSIANERICSLEARIASLTLQLDESRTLAETRRTEFNLLRTSNAETIKKLDDVIRDTGDEIALLTLERDQFKQKSEDSAAASVSAETTNLLAIKHADELKTAIAEMETRHQEVVEKIQKLAKQEQQGILLKAEKEQAFQQEKFTAEKVTLQEKSFGMQRELEKCRTELAQFQESASEGSKSLETQNKSLHEKYNSDLTRLEAEHKKEIQNLEDRHQNEIKNSAEKFKTVEEKYKKEISEILEASKRSMIDQESRLKKESLLVEEKSLKSHTEAEEKKRLIAEEKHQKEKSELEEKFKKEKAKLQFDLDTAKAEIDKLRKDAINYEQLKIEQAKKFEKELFSRNDDIGKYTTRIKTIESEFDNFKTETVKSAVDFHDKLTTANNSIHKLTDNLASEKLKYSQLETEFKLGQDKMKSFQAQIDSVTAELDVSRSSSERLSKTNGEKEEHVKKLKQKVDELALTQTTLAKTIATLEKDKDVLQNKISFQSTKIAELESKISEQKEDFAKIKQADLKNAELLNETIASLKKENEKMNTTVNDGKSEYRAMEKRGALIIKDLQKQLVKERRRQISPEASIATESVESLVNNNDGRSRQASENMFRRPPKSHSSNEQTGNNGVGIPKVERLTTELLQLAKENETLNKRSKNAEEEIRSLLEKLEKQNEDLELKSKAVQQYMLREYSTQLQPDEKQRSGFSMDMLTNSNAMHKMNPVLLSQVNIKMQKLLEELTTKMMGLEEENQTLKRTGQTFLKSSAI
ncbi:hypothetical protein HK100_002530 [Physocladia obscura]|uniref:Uncharacterized protein n=1 Tax=Physocladia obscura TaxID=109957 RepID=A0AAD5XDS9_9FUNG|nr:hypothetical protein HK100_002530 [Physocladia obscura]